MKTGTVSFEIGRTIAAIVVSIFFWIHAFALGFSLFVWLYSPGPYSFIGTMLRMLLVNGIPCVLVLWGFTILRRKYGRSLLLLAAFVGAVFGFLSNFLIIIIPILIFLL